MVSDGGQRDHEGMHEVESPVIVMKTGHEREHSHTQLKLLQIAREHQQNRDHD